VSVRRAFLLAVVVGVLLFLAGLSVADGQPGTDDYRAASQSSVRPPVPHARFVKAVEQRRAADREVRRLRAIVRHDPSVQEALDIASLVYGTPRQEIERVAFCESRLDPRARNRTPIYNGEHATGLLQTIPSSFRRSPFRELDIYSPYANALAGAYIWSLSGSWREWACRP